MGMSRTAYLLTRPLVGLMHLAWFLFCVFGAAGAWVNVWILNIRDWRKGERS
jgi:hypothetical protein